MASLLSLEHILLLRGSVEQQTLARNVRSGESCDMTVSAACHLVCMMSVLCIATDGLQFKLSDTVDKKQYLVKVLSLLFTG